MFVAGSLLVGPVGRAADRRVHFQVPPPLRQGLASMPLIADPADAAENRINTALRRLDAAVRKAAGNCKGNDGNAGDWERSVDVPMRGPGYLSFVITDSAFCGGAHPDVATMSIVYDLRTGSPVDWTQLLPPSLTGKLALQEGADGTKMVTLASKRLLALYLAGYRTGNATGDDQAECAQAIRDVTGDGAPAMMAWLDSKDGGLAVQFELPHAVQACEEPVVIPIETLRAEGAQAALLDSIEAAR
jgi:hypothetical protein